MLVKKELKKYDLCKHFGSVKNFLDKQKNKKNVICINKKDCVTLLITDYISVVK